MESAVAARKAAAAPAGMLARRAGQFDGDDAAARPAATVSPPARSNPI